MIRINEHYRKLTASYLFVQIAELVKEHQKARPDADIIELGIGDVTLPLPPACVEAMRNATDEMGRQEQFRGYGPEQGYPFLRKTIAQHDYRNTKAPISPDEIFISDGTKCDIANFLDILGIRNTVAVPDPVYPVYVDTNVMVGRTGESHDGRYQGLHYLDGTPENGFVPEPPEEPVDIVYLCFPNNPTGATATRAQLAHWVDYARSTKALILFDAAYERFITDPAIPHSIYEIDGAETCAVEFRSFSKTAGFTGMRCAFTVVPEACKGITEEGEEHSLRALWSRRQGTKFNGVAYPVQRAAEAAYSPEGSRQVAERIDSYLANAATIRRTMENLGYRCTGGDNSPYVWVEAGDDSWQLFRQLLNEASVVTTPGTGFGLRGEGFIRISAFNHHERVEKALERIHSALA